MAGFHNSPLDSSENSIENLCTSVDSRSRTRSRETLKLAAQIARQVGLTATWPNVQTVKLAIECEAEYSDVSLANAAALIAAAANEFTIIDPQMYSFQAAAILRKSNVVNRFWFEDSMWRHKEAYSRLLALLPRGSRA